MTAYSRAGFKWTVNEILSLQREFELLGLDIDQISTKHKRSPDAIMYKLDQEGFADYNVLYSNYYDLNARIQVDRKSSPSLNLQSCCDETECCPENDDDEEYDDEECYDDCDDEDYIEEEVEEDEDEYDEEYQEDEEKVANLSERVEGLEESIFEIRDMIKNMMSSLLSQKPNCASSCM